MSNVEWSFAEVASPHISAPVPVIAAREIPYIAHAHRLQSLSVYLPRTPETEQLVGTPVTSLPGAGAGAAEPAAYQVHIHGGAWRHPALGSESIEATVAHAFTAHAFTAGDDPFPVRGIASLNYTLSQFPTHPASPYDAVKDNHTQIWREGVHPQHVSDVLHGLCLLGSLGLTAGSYVLTGHSAGACLAFQAVMQPPRHYGLDYLPEPPAPAALLGVNGLYDLPALATASGLGASHARERDDYDRFLSNAFGRDKREWPAASPALFAAAAIEERVREGRVPRLVVLEQSAEDQLVPMNQRERFVARLGGVGGLRVVEGHRCTGRHAAPWEEGFMMWDALQDVLRLLHAGW